MRILYLDTYVTSAPDHHSSSDSIGYGITSSGAIRREFEKRGIAVDILDPLSLNGGRKVTPSLRRTLWTASQYPALVHALQVNPPDLIFAFHSFVVSPALIRYIQHDLGLHVPIVGYTHGSHWDTTDTYRVERYPGLEMLDLANLDALDRILVVSRYTQRTLDAAIARLHPEVAERLTERVRCVGLPLDTELMDRCRTTDRGEAPLIVFNHAPIASKNPRLFAEAMSPVLSRTNARLLITRRFPQGGPGTAELDALRQRFGNRVVFGCDMDLHDYYRALWSASIQVSTATHESLGVATLEAMYTGTCCLLPRVGSYPEICGDHPDVLYPAGDVDTFIERLLMLVGDADRRNRIGAELAILARLYTPEKIVDRIVQVFDEMAGEGKWRAMSC